MPLGSASSQRSWFKLLGRTRPHKTCQQEYVTRNLHQFLRLIAWKSPAYRIPGSFGMVDKAIGSDSIFFCWSRSASLFQNSFRYSWLTHSILEIWPHFPSQCPEQCLWPSWLILYDPVPYSYSPLIWQFKTFMLWIIVDQNFYLCLLGLNGHTMFSHHPAEPFRHGLPSKRNRPDKEMKGIYYMQLSIYMGSYDMIVSNLKVFSKNPFIFDKNLFFPKIKKLVFGKRPTNLWVLGALGIYIYVYVYIYIYICIYMYICIYVCVYIYWYSCWSLDPSWKQHLFFSWRYEMAILVKPRSRTLRFAPK